LVDLQSTAQGQLMRLYI